MISLVLNCWRNRWENATAKDGSCFSLAQEDAYKGAKQVFKAFLKECFGELDIDRRLHVRLLAVLTKPPSYIIDKKVEGQRIRDYQTYRQICQQDILEDAMGIDAPAGFDELIQSLEDDADHGTEIDRHVPDAPLAPNDPYTPDDDDDIDEEAEAAANDEDDESDAATQVASEYDDEEDDEEEDDEEEDERSQPESDHEGDRSQESDEVEGEVDDRQAEGVAAATAEDAMDVQTDDVPAETMYVVLAQVSSSAHCVSRTSPSKRTRSSKASHGDDNPPSTVRK